MGARSWDSRLLRRAGLAGAVVSGVTLVASGVQGLVGVDGRLEAASEPRPAAFVVERERGSGDCPFTKSRRLDRRRL